MAKILLIEDDLTISKLYSMKLELENHTIVKAYNGLEGLYHSKDTKFDVVLLDLRMPVMSGEEFLQKFRKIDANTEIPVIILTNISREEAPKTIWHYGIHGYFVKAHSTPKDLAERVDKLLSEKQLE